MFTGICGIHFIVIQTNTLINLGHGFKKANALILGTLSIDNEMHDDDLRNPRRIGSRVSFLLF